MNLATRWRQKGILFSVEKSEEDALKSPLVGKIGKILNIQGNRLSVGSLSGLWLGRRKRRRRMMNRLAVGDNGDDGEGKRGGEKGEKQKQQ